MSRLAVVCDIEALCLVNGFTIHAVAYTRIHIVWVVCNLVLLRNVSVGAHIEITECMMILREKR